MKVKRKPRKNLNREDWIAASLELLVAEGIGAVSIDRLATGLGVTRGSFYHHFSDRNELLDVLLGHWAEELTYRVRDDVISLKLDPATTLLVLLRNIRSKEAAKYDAPFRAWAIHDERAREVLTSIDQVRYATIRSQFEQLGFEGPALHARARMFLYYETAAPAIFLTREGVDGEAVLAERLRILTSK
jgi:AcrR family transcriptional regulator